MLRLWMFGEGRNPDQDGIGGRTLKSIVRCCGIHCTIVRIPRIIEPRASSAHGRSRVEQTAIYWKLLCKVLLGKYQENKQPMYKDGLVWPWVSVSLAKPRRSSLMPGVPSTLASIVPGNTLPYQVCIITATRCAPFPGHICSHRIR